jgi:SM-20-related protein
MNLLLSEKLNAIADGLADKGYAIIDNFLSPEEVKAIIELGYFSKGFNDFKKAGIGQRDEKQINEAIRGDFIKWIDRHTAPDEIMVYLHRLNELISFVHENLFISLKDYEVHLTMYPPGSYYKRHLDQFKKDDHRRLSVICYLNENWKAEEGGQLRIYEETNQIDVLPEAGRLVCFRSDKLEHEVLPASRARLSLTGWILDQYADLKHLS